ncbi:acyl-CoA dehydrogenase [Paraburkholderia ginsengiterrae]|uniref:Acyl-CoA dehydrogenase n=1 Tax=Paraburkholderia ginsengiterrae TaxID=1462993 RepID=A0A1A9NA68_9BURK|nr:acyl-CoA dehydrogenase family protein [Paraburkholderia ginsengiterrae]OAJ51635.1 acyl-CoA dehydrogenase [Paraburkholderia ginsengiterrae]OAJ61822.1 acyl-CoA dehydrogenase [Paraburkholderia ginsengiterrae]
MNFQPDAGLQAFRAEVRAFLLEYLPASLRGQTLGVRSSCDAMARWQRILNDHGWGAPSWTSEHGGTGWDAAQLQVFDEECAALGAPKQDVFAHRLLGPVMNAFASSEQRAEHMPAILRGERFWCQGFSEPGAGSDLASLRTQAVRDGDYYVVNGQKTWTSYAHEADWIFLLVRTDPAAKKQAGISFLLVDMKTPGITVRPIITIDGCHHLNETYFDNVRVPVGNRIGAEGDGWKATKFLLNNEHAATADLPSLLRYMQVLKRLATSQFVGSVALAQRPEFALRLAQMEGELRALEVMVHRVAELEREQSPVTHVMGSLLKIRGTDLQQRMTGLLVESLGDYGAVAYLPAHDHAVGMEPLPWQQMAQGIATEMFFRRASTIYGGTSEVQRGIVAKLMFQL